MGRVVYSKPEVLLSAKDFLACHVYKGERRNTGNVVSQEDILHGHMLELNIEGDLAEECLMRAVHFTRLIKKGWAFVGTHVDKSEGGSVRCCILPTEGAICDDTLIVYSNGRVKLKSAQGIVSVAQEMARLGYTAMEEPAIMATVSGDVYTILGWRGGVDPDNAPCQDVYLTEWTQGQPYVWLNEYGEPILKFKAHTKRV